MTSRTVLWLLAGLGLVSCNDDPGNGPSHIDCSGGLYCSGGTVLREERSPVPVSVGSCPRTPVHTCARGCAIASAPLSAKPESLCVGWTGDAGPARDGAARDAKLRETGSGSDATAVSCTVGGAPCSGGLTCQCCGSIGPKAICICSRACSADGECQGTGLSSCNRPSPASPGICTPPGFNCCWMCQ